MVKTITKRIATGLVSIIGLVGVSNSVGYVFDRITLKDHNSCETAFIKLNYINHENNFLNYGSRLAHEHYLEKYCKK